MGKTNRAQGREGLVRGIFVGAMIAAPLIGIIAALPLTVEVGPPPTAHVTHVEAKVHEPEAPVPPEIEPRTLEDEADAIADEFGVERATLRNLAYYESRWDPNAIGDKGCSVGIAQINLCVHTNITREQALDPIWSLRYAAKEISEGRESAWSVCNCYAIAKNEYLKKGIELPRMDDIEPSGLPPELGGLAIFYYHGVKHIAIIVAMEADGFWVFEGNYDACAVGKRFIKFDDKNLVGTWYAG